MDFVSLPLTVGHAGRWIWNNVAPGLGVSVVLVFVVALVGEIYLLDQGAAGRAEAPTQIRIAGKPVDGIGHRGSIVRRYQQSVVVWPRSGGRRQRLRAG